MNGRYWFVANIDIHPSCKEYSYSVFRIHPYGRLHNTEGYALTISSDIQTHEIEWIPRYFDSLEYKNNVDVVRPFIAIIFTNSTQQSNDFVVAIGLAEHCPCSVDVVFLKDTDTHYLQHGSLVQIDDDLLGAYRSRLANHSS